MQKSSLNQLTFTDLMTAEQLLAAGYNALADGDDVQAEAFFRQAVQVNVRSAEAWRALADTQTGARHAICLRWAESIEAAQRQAKPILQQRPIPIPRRRFYYARMIGAVSAGALVLLVFGSDVVYRERILPGVAIGSINVSHQRMETVEDTIKQHQQAAARSVEVQVGEHIWRAPIHTLIHEPVPELAEAAMSYGHEQSFWPRTVTRMRAFLGQQHIIDAPLINEAAVKAFVASIASEIRRERHDAHIRHSEQGWTIVREQTGLMIDQAQLLTRLTDLLRSSAWQAQHIPQPLIVEPISDVPARTVADLEPLRQRLQELASQPLELQIGDQRWTLDRSMLVHAGTDIDPAALKPNPALIAQQLESIAAEIAVAPQPSYLERAADRVRAIVPGKAGRELDREASVLAVAAAVETNAPHIALPIREVQPPPGEAEQLGLIAELGRGESQFVTYSSPARDANVQAGGNDVDGLLIAPGEVFSFTQSVGEITWEKGYRWGEMIEAGALVPSLGGGICQVSTTVFRAAFWSGLEIVERHNHTWRLPWYEVDAPPGMDATIALGGPDLKIRNNTQHYILLKVETDLTTKRQTVIIYGTPDGRKVEMEPLANGNIGVRRHVLNGTQVVGEDTFVSYYTQ